MDALVDHVRPILDTLMLIGILLTAVYSIFKAGRWFGKMVDSLESVSANLARFKIAFEQHTVEEDRRFVTIEKAVRHHSERIDHLGQKIQELTSAGE